MTPLSRSSSSSACSSARQSEARQSASRYSPPRIGGASSTKAMRSSSAGAGTRGAPPAAVSPPAQTAATKRMAKPRQKASSGVRRLPASAAPSCSRPCPPPRAKAASSRPARPSSSEEECRGQNLEAQRAVGRQNGNGGFGHRRESSPGNRAARSTTLFVKRTASSRVVLTPSRGAAISRRRQCRSLRSTRPGTEAAAPAFVLLKGPPCPARW